MNTVIITENKVGLNSQEFWGYALQASDEPSGPDNEPVPTIELLACPGERRKSFIVISTFYGDPTEACLALASLLDAIRGGDDTWDVRGYNSIDFGVVKAEEGELNAP